MSCRSYFKIQLYLIRDSRRRGAFLWFSLRTVLFFSFFTCLSLFYTQIKLVFATFFWDERHFVLAYQNERISACFWRTLSKIWSRPATLGLLMRSMQFTHAHTVSQKHTRAIDSIPFAIFNFNNQQNLHKHYPIFSTFLFESLCCSCVLHLFFILIVTTR